jgi:exodeoxyribonuclease-3
MKIATWNVNSIRTRLNHVTQWLQTQPVDVLCVQETKVADDLFPQEAFTELGYQTYIFGQKAYNGVAFISRIPLEPVKRGFTEVLGAAQSELDEQKRAIAGCVDDLCIVNLYVPNGSSVGSDKYDYKLRWLEVLRDYLKTLLESHARLVACGDFNIAPEDRDIHDPTGRETHIMASDRERDALHRAILDLGLVDIFRQFHPEEGHFSWWDYRQGSFRRNRGWRIDHHYLSPALQSEAIACEIDIAPRRLEKPSDHTPVILELKE